jgi:hypothetical protein
MTSNCSQAIGILGFGTLPMRRQPVLRFERPKQTGSRALRSGKYESREPVRTWLVVVEVEGLVKASGSVTADCGMKLVPEGLDGQGMVTLMKLRSKDGAMPIASRSPSCRIRRRGVSNSITPATMPAARAKGQAALLAGSLWCRNFV